MTTISRTSRQRKMISGVAVATLLWGMALGIQTGARADIPGRHAGLVHAFDDLNYARTWLTVPGENNVVGRERTALFQIDKALYEVIQAGHADRKNMGHRYPVDASINHQGRLHKALDLVRDARKELDYPESNKAARGWRNLAISHVIVTIDTLRQAIKDVGGDS